jgi:hypothetical protein
LKFFNAVTFRNANVVKVPKSIYRYTTLDFSTPTGTALVHVIDNTKIEPILTADEAERLFISDKLENGAMGFSDFGMTPYTVEEILLKFIKLYLPDNLHNTPFEDIVGKFYTTE